MDQALRSRILASVRMPKLRIERALIVTQAHKDIPSLSFSHPRRNPCSA
jgi:hypothetical protein